ncbi:MAG: integration host factor subunit alpha [Deltaproteobacteria bacterium]|nr:integration host factor subunit alpha [Deltaproteobacteria bacterium]
MTLTKEDLVNSIKKQLDLQKRKSANLVDSLLEIIKKTLENGEDILISGFGKFCVKETNEHRGRNPRIGDDLTPGARRVIIFRCSPVLSEKINDE